MLFWNCRYSRQWKLATVLWNGQLTTVGWQLQTSDLQSSSMSLVKNDWLFMAWHRGREHWRAGYLRLKIAVLTARAGLTSCLFQACTLRSSADVYTSMTDSLKSNWPIQLTHKSIVEKTSTTATYTSNTLNQHITSISEQQPIHRKANRH